MYLNMIGMQQQNNGPGESRKALMETLYLRYASALLSFLLSQTAVREDAEDLLLEVFSAALQYRQLEQLPERVQAQLLWRIARHKLIDSYRRTSRRPAVSIELMLNELFANEEQAPEYAALRGEEFSWLHTALRAMPPLQQRILKLRFVHDMRSPEIAALVGKSETAVRSLLARALNQLRTLYREGGE